MESTLLPRFRADLESFASSSSSFRVVDTVPSPPIYPPKTVHVLDSSFNPPTQAHLRIALSALHSNAPKPQRLLLLLATQNADKAPKPAAFEHRIAMMRLLAQIVQNEYTTTSGRSARGIGADQPVAIDVGITKNPYFHDKAIGIEDSGFYADPETGDQPLQVHLLGFDSLIRLLDTKYYTPEHTLAPVGALLGKHRIRVTRRTEEGNKWGTEEEQDRPREELAKGEREPEGGRREWAQSIEMVPGEGDAISSTRVRESANSGKWDDVNKLVGRRVREWIEEYQLYKESVAKG
ncbi:MAG: hypothetical protein Q9197_002009 [Variospora fuerteventurae]